MADETRLSLALITFAILCWLKYLKTVHLYKFLSIQNNVKSACAVDYSFAFLCADLRLLMQFLVWL